MKVKLLLGALVLPAMFAACTNDVLEQAQTTTPDSSVLGGRAKGDVTLAATRSDIEGADTRVEGVQNGNGINWKWTDKNDKLGGVVVDYGKDGAIVKLEDYPEYVITNYPFAPVNPGGTSADFSTPTAVVDGAYMFYSQYDGDNTKRRTISHEMTRLQMVDAGWDAGLKQVGSSGEGQNFFVSPIVDLAIADDEDMARPLGLTSAHSILHIQFGSDLEAKYYESGLKINKVVVRTMDANANFKLAQTLDPFKIAELQKEVKMANPGLAIDANGSIDGMSNGAQEAINAVIAELTNTKKPVADISEYDDKKVTKDLVYQLKEPFVFKSSEDVFDLLVVFPEGTYKNAVNKDNVGNDIIYQGQNQGSLHLTIYTSEGTYDEYITPGKDLTVHRSEKINIRNRKFIIKPDKTNINLFDPNKGLNVESTEDWNYVIDYIKEHSRDFGNGSDWKFPVVNLTEGTEIVVDKDHFFPDCRVQYIGDATLKLDAEQDYTIDPEKVILATGDKRPTIEVVKENATITLEDIHAGLTGTDGTDVTKAIKLISAGKVIVPAKAKVDFEQLVSKKALEIGNEAVVNANSATDVVLSGETTIGKKAAVTLEGNKVETNGVAAVGEEAVLTVKSDYINNAAVTIAAKAKAILKGNAKNAGSIEVAVTGSLSDVQTFTNSGTVTMLGDTELQLNKGDRSVAEFQNLVNQNVINVQAGADKKGTYGGKVTVNYTLINESDANINVNGEFFAENVAAASNYGVITLEEDPYAVLRLNDKFLSNEKGYIFLKDATQYEMFDSYYSLHNQLKDARGVIATEMNQATYDAVIKNYGDYNGKQETAWEVLNKVIVNGEVKLNATLTDEKDFFLKANSSINAQAALTVNSLTAEGAATALNGAAISVNGTVTVDQDADLTNNVALTIAPAAATMLQVNGTFTNKGTLDTEDSSDENDPNEINTVISTTGKFVNKGMISKKAEPAEGFSGKNYEALNNLMKGLFVEEGKYQGTWNAQTPSPRVDYVSGTTAAWSNGEAAWNQAVTASGGITMESIKNILTGGTLEMVANFQAITFTSGNATWSIYLGGEQGETVVENSFMEYVKTSGIIEAVDKIAQGEEDVPYVTTTWFSGKNYGTLDLSADDLQTPNVWAYGVNKQESNNAVKIGYFTNEPRD